MEMTLKDIADRIGGELIGDPSVTVYTITNLEGAASGALIWIEKKRYLKAAEETEAEAIICKDDIESSSKPLIRVRNPKLAFARIAQLFFPPPQVLSRDLTGRHCQPGS